MQRERESSRKEASVEGCWNILKLTLLKATDWSYGWTKDPARQRGMWLWNDNNNIASNSFSEKLELWKKYGETRIRGSICKQGKRLEWIFTRPNVNQKRKDLETLC